jgi:hypothetical protein
MSKELIEQLAKKVGLLKESSMGDGTIVLGNVNATSLEAFAKAYQAAAPIDNGIAEALEKAAKYDAINTPEINDFLKAIENEALHQRDRWGSEHDAGKTDADWFWLVGYLAGKVINKPEKALHHIITTAAACLNWHSAKLGTHNKMRPGIDGDALIPDTQANNKQKDK